MPLKHVFPFHFCPNKNILVGVMCAREGVSGHCLQHVHFNDDYMTKTNRQNSSLKKENWWFSKNPLNERGTCGYF